jgi:hypothetical protein
MIPFIDLLLVTISFLLLTAVWTSLGRIDTSANLPNASRSEQRPVDEASALLVRAVAKDNSFQLEWQRGTVVDPIATVADTRSDDGRFHRLETAIARAWVDGRARRRFDAEKESPAAIVSVDNGRPFGDVAAILDAASVSVARACAEGASSGHCATSSVNGPAFAVRLSAR